MRSPVSWEGWITERGPLLKGQSLLSLRQHHQQGMWAWSYHTSLIFKRSEIWIFCSITWFFFSELGSVSLNHTHTLTRMTKPICRPGWGSGPQNQKEQQTNSLCFRLEVEILSPHCRPGEQCAGSFAPLPRRR